MNRREYFERDNLLLAVLDMLSSLGAAGWDSFMQLFESIKWVSRRCHRRSETVRAAVLRALVYGFRSQTGYDRECLYEFRTAVSVDAYLRILSENIYRDAINVLFRTFPVDSPRDLVLLAWLAHALDRHDCAFFTWVARVAVVCVAALPPKRPVAEDHFARLIAFVLAFLRRPALRLSIAEAIASAVKPRLENSESWSIASIGLLPDRLQRLFFGLVLAHPTRWLRAGLSAPSLRALFGGAPPLTRVKRAAVEILRAADADFPELWRAFAAAGGDSLLAALASALFALRPAAHPLLCAHFRCEDPLALLRARARAERHAAAAAASLLFCCERREEFDLLLELIAASPGPLDLHKAVCVVCDMLLAQRPFACAVLGWALSAFASAQRAACDAIAWHFLGCDCPAVCEAVFAHARPLGRRVARARAHALVEAVLGGTLPSSALEAVAPAHVAPEDDFWRRLWLGDAIAAAPREPALVKAVCWADDALVGRLARALPALADAGVDLRRAQAAVFSCEAVAPARALALAPCFPAPPADLPATVAVEPRGVPISAAFLKSASALAASPVAPGKDLARSMVLPRKAPV
jgi:hypothetical protein